MMKFQPAHSPELGGRREDKLAASALREQNAGRNLPQKNRLLKVANSCGTSLGDLTWKQKVPAPHRVGKKGSPRWRTGLGFCQAQWNKTSRCQSQFYRIIQDSQIG